VHSRAHFRIFGIPVRVEPFFVIVAVLFGINLDPLWSVLLWILAVFVSVLVHELAHALTYRLFGQRSAVVLHGFGGFTVAAGGGRRVLSKGRSIAVSLSGALAQIVLLGLTARWLLRSDWMYDQLLSHFQDHLSIREFSPVSAMYFFVSHLEYVSIWWGLFNLLPIRPLDGGHVSETLLGFETACKVSIAAAVVAGVLAFREPQIQLFGLMFFGLLAFLNYRDLREGQHSTAFAVEAPDTPGGSGPPRGGGGAARPGRPGRPGRGRRRGADLSIVRPTSGPLDVGDLTPRLSAGEAESRAWNALRGGDGKKAATIIDQAGGDAKISPFLRASAALITGPHEMADDLFNAAYRAEPAGPPNLVPATLLADHERAVPVAERLVSSGTVGVEAAGGLQTHLHYAERFRAAAEVGEKVYEAGPRSRAQTAFEVACSWARADDAERALQWVGAAVDAGFRAPGLLDGEPDLAPVRSLPGWAAVRARLSA
jgi:Zn-dependent protease